MDQLVEALIREVLLATGQDSTTPEGQQIVNDPKLRTMIASRIQGWISQKLELFPIAPMSDYAYYKAEESQQNRFPVYVSFRCLKAAVERIN